MPDTPVYLDHNATAPARPEAVAAVVAAMARCGNPSSVHAAGRAAREVVEGARDRVAALAGVAPDRVVFTAGGTEANNLALAGHERLLVSAVEHDSVLKAASGARRIPVDGLGRVDPAAVDRLLGQEPGRALVSVMLANNETGVIQPVVEIAGLARRHGAIIHCDAVQGAGRLPLAEIADAVDMLTLSAHKAGGPRGVGALVLSGEHLPRPLIRGGGQERGLRAGTENVAGIAGFGAVADAVAREAMDTAPLRALRDLLEAGIREIAPEAVIVGEAAARLPNTCCVALPGVAAGLQVMALDLAGVAVSAGAACSSGKVTTSHVLAAMELATEIADSAIRVSFGQTSDAADIDRFLEAWRGLRERRSGSAAA